MKKIIFILLLTFACSQKLIVNLSEYQKLENEINSIKDESIHPSLSVIPFIQDRPERNAYINIVADFDLENFFVVEPFMGIRSSNSGFEMYSDEVPSSCMWLSPGIKVNSTLPLMMKHNSIWMYSWSEFYKHSAYGFNNASIDKEINLFNYYPDYSTSFYVGTVSPETGGIDFDQSEGGISILSDTFKLIFGKFSTSLGPSLRSNLSIGNTAPPFEQIFLQYTKGKLTFTYLMGSLDSNIPLSNDVDDLYTDQWELDLIESTSSRVPEHARYISNHRIDLNINKCFRIGLYEQIIFGARDIPPAYLLPVLPFWSSQHEQGDLDNVMIGFDIDYIKNTNRFYLSFLIDEWAPYSTFKKENRNWFAIQVGVSKFLTFASKDFLVKAEYTRTDPRAYSHRFSINEPKHHGYNIGYWSGRNSDDLIISISSILDNYSLLRCMYEYTRFPIDNYLETLENQYSDNIVSFLDEGFNFRKKISIFYTTPTLYNMNLDLEFGRIENQGLYNVEEFDEIRINLRYNINK